MFAVLGRLTLLLLSHLLLTLLGEALSRLLCLLPGALLVGLAWVRSAALQGWLDLPGGACCSVLPCFLSCCSASAFQQAVPVVSKRAQELLRNKDSTVVLTAPTRFMSRTSTASVPASVSSG